jgi:ATP-binding cassette subfamily F protein uup
MGIIAINDISVSFGGPLLLDGATLQIDAGERIGLSGRNGAGKSTLLKLIRGDIVPDQGAIIRAVNLRVAMLPQEVPDDLPGTVYDVVASGSQEHLDLLREYRTQTNQMTQTSNAGLLKRLAEIQHRLETSGARR